MITKDCRWILEVATPERPRGRYCQAAVGYKVPDDGTGYRARVYDTFCPEHMARYEQMELLDDEDESEDEE